MGLIIPRIAINKDTLSNYQLDISGNLYVSGSTLVDGSLSFKNQQITGVATPINSSDAANKYFVTSSLLPYATNASINSAAFIKSSALNPYATNASVGTALLPYATNASINAAGFIGPSGLLPYATNSSINAAGFIKSSALNPYATNASVGTALNKYLPLVGGTLTGQLDIRGSSKNTSADFFFLSSNEEVNTNQLIFTQGANNEWYIQAVEQGIAFRNIHINPYGGNVYINEGLVWNAVNDGPGSGLDADIVDGYHATSFFKQLADPATVNADAYSQTNQFESVYRNNDAYPGQTNFPTSYGQLLQFGNTVSDVQFYATSAQNQLLFRSKWWTQEWTAWNTMWHSGNSNISSVDWNAKNLILSGASPYVDLFSSGWNAHTYIQNGVSLDGNTTGDYLLFMNPASKGFSFEAGTSNRLLITPAGLIGIHKTPSYLLDIEGIAGTDGILARVQGDQYNGAVIDYNRAGVYHWSAGIGGQDVGNGIPVSYFGIAESGVVPRLVIAHTTGNVGIGTTSPFAKITLPSGGSYVGLLGWEAGTDSASHRWWMHTDYAIGGDFSISSEITKQHGPNPQVSRFYIDPIGNVGLGTLNPSDNLHVLNNIRSSNYMYAVNFILSSDASLKDKITPISTEPVNAEYKQFVMKNNPEQIRYGVIAQELQKVNPELVIKGADGMLSVSYIDLLIKEIASLKARVNELENKIR
jgi:hypothetical protein